MWAFAPQPHLHHTHFCKHVSEASRRFPLSINHVFWSFKTRSLQINSAERFYTIMSCTTRSPPATRTWLLQAIHREVDSTYWFLDLFSFALIVWEVVFQLSNLKPHLLNPWKQNHLNPHQLLLKLSINLNHLQHHHHSQYVLYYIHCILYYIICNS